MGANQRVTAPWKSQLLVFLAFFPYPELAGIGDNFSVQLAQVLALLVVLTNVNRVLVLKSTAAAVALIVPGFVSLALVVILGRASNPTIAVGTFVTAFLVVACLPGFGLLASRRSDYQWLVPPVAIALIAHAAIATIQWLAFQRGDFPFTALFVNRSFADLQSLTEEWALYVQRPMGLFPEPSAAAAVIGPWSALLLITALDRGAKYRRLALAASLAGILTVIMGRSVYLFFLIPTVTAMLVLALLDKRFDRSRIVVTMLGLTTLLAVAPSGWWDRADLALNNSLATRMHSITGGMQLVAEDLSTAIIGLGPGQIGDSFARAGLPFDAVYSLVANFFVASGVMMLIGVAYVVVLVGRSLRRGTEWAVAFLLLVSFTVTTSYVNLLGMWLLLGVLLDTRGPISTLSTTENAARAQALREGVPESIRSCTQAPKNVESPCEASNGAALR